MDLGAAAEGIAMAHLAGWLLCALALHFIALLLCLLDPLVRGRRPSAARLVALALISACHTALAVSGVWYRVVVGSAWLWSTAFAVTAGWIGLMALRAAMAPRFLAAEVRLP